MNKKILIGVAGAVGLAEYNRFSRLMDSVSIKPKNLKVALERGNFKLDFQLQFINNGSKSIDIQRIYGDMYIGDVFIGTYNTTQTDTIQPNTTVSLPVTAIISSKQILDNLQGKAFSSGVITIKTNAVLKFKVLGIFTIPVSIKNVSSIEAGSIVREATGIVRNIITLFKQ